MKILYFTLEDIRSSLFENQVLDLLVARKDINRSDEITLFVINKPTSFFKAMKLEEKLKGTIRFLYVPLSPPMRYYTSSIFINKIYIFILKLVCKFNITLSDYDVIHCRHYLPSLVMKELGAKNIHFDVRSLSLYEYVAAGKIKQGTSNFTYWLNQERKLIKYVAGLSVVSKTMINYFSDYKRSIHYCPIIVNFDKFKFSQESRDIFREMWGWSSSNVYVYSGSFGLYGVNKDALGKLINYIINYDAKAKFLFLVSNNQKEFNDFLRDHTPNKIDYKYYSVQPKDVSSYLSAADIGIHALPPQLDSNTRLGTKIVEYWAMGIPTLITSTIGEAADLSRQYSLGQVIDLDDKANSKFEFKREIYDRNFISSWAFKNFSIQSVLHEYDSSYKTIALNKTHGNHIHNGKSMYND